MAFDLRLQHKVTPQLVMTPQLQQAIGFLQLSHLEMVAALKQEIVENPVFDDEGAGREPGEQSAEGATEFARAESSVESPAALGGYASSFGEARNHRQHAAAGGETALEALPANPASLTEHLHWQLKMAHIAPHLIPAAEALVEEVGSDGYLPAAAIDTVAAALAMPTEQVRAALEVVQSLEPVGVAARSLQECLTLQATAAEAPSPLVLRLIAHHLPDIERVSISELARKSRACPDEVRAAIAHIRGLEPLPGRAFVSVPPAYTVPDIFVAKTGGDDAAAEGDEKWQIWLNDDLLPPLVIAKQYESSQTAHFDEATRHYLQDKLRAAHWLIRAVAMRQKTVLKVMASILRFQAGFFEEGASALKPLTLREVAADVGMHESTISRVTTNKFVETPQGLFELKYFFNSGLRSRRGAAVGSASVRSHIERLIAQENKHAPLSDQKIVDFLQTQDIRIARRTVAKYRKMLRQHSSCARRRSL